MRRDFGSKKPDSELRQVCTLRRPVTRRLQAACLVIVLSALATSGARAEFTDDWTAVGVEGHGLTECMRTLSGPKRLAVTFKEQPDEWTELMYGADCELRSEGGLFIRTELLAAEQSAGLNVSSMRILTGDRAGEGAFLGALPGVAVILVGVTEQGTDSVFAGYGYLAAAAGVGLSIAGAWVGAVIGGNVREWDVCE